METIIKCTSVAIIGALFCLVVKKQNPEIAYLLSLLITVFIFLNLSSSIESFMGLVSGATDMLPESDVIVKPMLKCLAFGFIGKLGSDVCKDFSQLALASSLQFACTLCSAAVATPVLLKTLRMIGSLI